MAKHLSPGHSYSSPTTNTSQGQTTNPGAPANANFKMTEGWYVAFACIGSVMVANTRLGPVAFGIMSIALIYQTNLLLQGK